MKNLLGVAKQQKITDEEIGVVLSIVMAVVAGGVRGRLREALSTE
jgi:hypothetical protein